MAFQMHLDTEHPKPEEAYREFNLDRPGNIIFVGHHLDMPLHFFLEILGIRDEIGSTMVKREDEFVTISFNMLLNPEFLHHVLRLSFETSL